MPQYVLYRSSCWLAVFVVQSIRSRNRLGPTSTPSRKRGGMQANCTRWICPVVAAARTLRIQGDGPGKRWVYACRSIQAPPPFILGWWITWEMGINLHYSRLQLNKPIDGTLPSFTRASASSQQAPASASLPTHSAVSYRLRRTTVQYRAGVWHGPNQLRRRLTTSGTSWHTGCVQ